MGWCETLPKQFKSWSQRLLQSRRRWKCVLASTIANQCKTAQLFTPSALTIYVKRSDRSCGRSYESCCLRHNLKWIHYVNIVYKEVRQSLGVSDAPQPQAEAMSYAAAVCSTVPPLRQRQDTTQPYYRRHTPPSTPPPPCRSPAGQHGVSSKTDVWCAPNNHPLCYHCEQAGHTYRCCQCSQIGLRGFAVNVPPP